MGPSVSRQRNVGVSARVVGGVVAAARAVGIDPSLTLRRLGIDSDRLDDLETRIPVETEEALWDEMARLSGDPFFGLHAQQHLPAGHGDVLDYAVRSSPTLADAFDVLVRYNRLLHDAAEFELHMGTERTRLVQRFRGDPVGTTRQVADYSLGALVTVCRQLVGDDWRPLEIRFRHARPAGAEEYRRFFGRMPEFDCDANEIVLSRALLRRPLTTADPHLHRVMRRHAAALLAERPRPDGIVDEVRAALAPQLQGGAPSVTSIAAAVGINVRTLQRRLRQEGTSYQDLVEEMRRALALRMLDERRLPVAQIASDVGFSEPSAFHRAFKRWTGLSPDVWRARRRMDDPGSPSRSA
ncbi:MAG: AraC family transcriptional regulator [Deltaproteobacteria bacterium]|nr:AraC family transcriptional regulator [Deltaproteobacteria bacterium]